MKTLSNDLLIDRYSTISSHNQALCQELKYLQQQFTRLGIEVLLVKGVDLLSRKATPLGVRFMNDIDLMFHGNDFSTIASILTERGYVAIQDGNPVFRHQGKGVTIDLMNSLLYESQEDNIWQRAEKIEWLGEEFSRMNIADAIIYHIYYAICQRASLRGAYFRDLELYLSELKEEERVFLVQRIKESGLSGVAFFGIKRFCENQVKNGDLAKEIMEQLQPLGFRDRCIIRWCEKYIDEGYRYGKGHVMLFLTCPWYKKFGYVWRQLFPSQDFMRHRYQVSGLKLMTWRIFRPFCLVGALIVFALKSAMALFSVGAKENRPLELIVQPQNVSNRVLSKLFLKLLLDGYDVKTRNLGDSMMPLFGSGSTLVIRGVSDVNEIRVGDVLVYSDHDEKNVLLDRFTTHRVVRIRKTKSGPIFYTRGDIEQYGLGGYEVKSTQVLGRVVEYEQNGKTTRLDEWYTREFFFWRTNLYQGLAMVRSVFNKKENG